MVETFLQEPSLTADVQALYEEDMTEDGYVGNAARLWAQQPETLQHLFGLMSEAFTPSVLSFRQRGILVAATAATLGDSACSLAWAASSPAPRTRSSRSPCSAGRMRA